jgi:carbamoyl-phosphate synthase large subunit
MSESQITVIRSAAGCLSAAALINELKSRGVRVIGLDCNPLSAGFYLCDKSYVVPRGDDPGFLEEILRICEAERPDAIISGPEEEILVLSKNKGLFGEKGILVLCPDYDTVKICADKLETCKVLESHGIPVPDIYKNDNARFPCIVKPRFGRGGAGVFRAESRRDLEFYIQDVEQPVIQEFIDGVEYTIDIFADLEGKPLSVIPRARLQVESGISVKAKTVYDEEIISDCAKIARKLKLTGPSCIQCIKNDQKVAFTEINPRFGGGSALSLKADNSIVANLIKIVRRETPVPGQGFEQGLTMLRYYREVFLAQDGAPLEGDLP